MQMTKQGNVKDVPDDLAEFMGARGWEPAYVAPATPETPAEEFVDAFVDWDTPEDEPDVVDPDDAETSTIDPAEEQS